MNTIERIRCMERLDEKILMAGDCSAILSADHLNVICDQEDNDLTITTIGDSVFVVGNNGTTINGGNGAASFDTDKIKINTKGGDDDIFMPSLIADSVFIKFGQGDDELRTFFGTTVNSLDVRGEAGDDNLGIVGVVAENIEADGGAGDDCVAFVRSVAEHVSAHGRAGFDKLVLLPGNIFGELEEKSFESPGTPLCG